MSTLRVNTLQTQAGVEVYTAKAWVNFNGTGTVAIRAAGNVSSITDIGTGSYRVNFTVAMPDTNYSFSGITGWNPGVEPSCIVGTSNTGLTTSYAVVYTLTNGGDTTYDLSQVLVAFFR